MSNLVKNTLEIIKKSLGYHKKKKKSLKKVKLLRVVTQSEVVPWHLNNFILRAVNDFDLYIVGNNVSKYKYDYPNVEFIDVKIRRKTSIIHDILAFFRLLLVVLRIRPQIIHSIMPKAGFLSAVVALISLVPIRIHTFTGQVWSSKEGISRSFFKSIDKLIFILNTYCLTDSPSQSLFLAENGFVTNAGPIPYLGKGSLSGVNLNIFNIELVREKNIMRRELGINDDDFVYIFLARKSKTKGINELIESFAQIAFLTDVKLLFIGPDESQGLLSKLLKKYESITDKIISLDKVKNHERYLALSDVLCIPSSSEGFGSIVIEAAALGVPSIGFDIIGLSDSIEHGYSGVLVPFKNVFKFSEAMILLHDNPTYLENLKVNGIKRVKNHFSADVIYLQQREVYNRLLNN